MGADFTPSAGWPLLLLPLIPAFPLTGQGRPAPLFVSFDSFFSSHSKPLHKDTTTYCSYYYHYSPLIFLAAKEESPLEFNPSFRLLTDHFDQLSNHNGSASHFHLDAQTSSSPSSTTIDPRSRKQGTPALAYVLPSKREKIPGQRQTSPSLGVDILTLWSHLRVPLL